MGTNPEPAMTERLLDEVDRAFPDRLVGLYLVGSAALGDHQGPRSDLDYVGVLDRPLTGSEFEALRAAHHRLGLARYDGIYVTGEELQGPATPEIGSAHVSAAGYLPHAGFTANPATWRTLARHGVAVRGPEATTLGVHDRDDELEQFCRENLTSYWREWGRQLSRNPKQAVFGLTDGGVVYGTLEPLRLHASLTTGRILAKTEAADHGLATFGDRWQPLLAQARAIRMTGARQPLGSRLTRWRDLGRFVELVTSSV